MNTKPNKQNFFSSPKILVLLSFLSMLAIVGVIAITYITLRDIYQAEPNLKYQTLTLTLCVFNGIPSLMIAVSLIRYGLSSLKAQSSETVFHHLKLWFYIQAILTTISLNVVGILEDISPPFWMFIAFFIVIISLTLGTLFSILRNNTQEKYS